MNIKVPLGWIQLTYERSRLWAGLAGIGFAIVLMFMQLGIQAALFDSSVQLHNSLKTDLVMISPRSTSLIAMRSFSRRRLYQALSFPDVQTVAPLYLGFAQWQNPSQPEYWRNIHIVGFDIRYSVFNTPTLMQSINKLSYPDVVFFDASSRPEYGPIKPWIDSGKAVSTEIDNLRSGSRSVRVVDTFRLGTSFGIDGNVITSHVNFLRLFPERQPGLIEVGLVRLKPGTSPASVQKRLQASIPGDVRIMTQQEWVSFEKHYWRTSTAIGFIFALGVGMGLIVGIVVVYQILYTSITQCLPEYATLKAMGYKDGFFFGLIVRQAFLLALLAYVPGILVAHLLYLITRHSTLLPIFMTAQRALFVFGLTVFMCCFSGFIATRKLRDADPAEIF